MPEHTTPRAHPQLTRQLLLVSAFAAIFLYLRTFLWQGIPFLAEDDQALFFVRAAHIVHGQTLYRDIFELVTPATDLLYAAYFRLFGIHAWVPAAAAIALGTALAAQLTWLANKLLRGPITYLPALLVLVLDYNTALDPTHHWYATFFALTAAGILCEAITVQRLVAAGIFTAVAALFTQTQGTLALIAVAIWLAYITRHQPIRQRLRQQLALIAPFCAVVAAVLTCYAHLATWHILYFDLITFPLQFLSADPTINSPRTYLHQFPSLHTSSDLLRFIPFVFIYALVPYLYFLALWQLRRKHSTLPTQQRRKLLLLTLLGLALAAAIASGPRFHRICTIAPPAVLLFTCMISAATPRLHRLRIALTVATLAFAVILIIHRQHEASATLQLPIGRTAFLQRDHRAFNEFQWLAQRTCPGEPFFGQSDIGLYLALTNPTHSDFLTDNETTRPQVAAAILAALQQQPPHYILLPLLPATSTGPHDHASPIRLFVHANYRLAQTFASADGLRIEQVWELAPAPR